MASLGIPVKTVRPEEHVRAAGLYVDEGAIPTALGQSRIGQAATGLLEKEMPQEVEAPEAFCTPDHAHHLVH